MKRKFLLLSFILASVSLTGCNFYTIETYYDEFKKKNSCALRNHLLVLDTSWGQGRRLELDLEKIDNNLILAQFILKGYNKNTFFKPQTRIIFKVTDINNNYEEILLKSISPIQLNEQLSYNGSYIPMHETTNVVSTEMTSAQVVKIANAKKVTVLLETIDKPMLDDLYPKDLGPLREFIDQCLVKK